MKRAGRAGVIGHPLGYSLSPVIFQAAFDASDIDARYEPWATPPEELEERVAGLRADDLLGANVTIPHKEAVAALLDRVDERAERAGELQAQQLEEHPAENRAHDSDHQVLRQARRAAAHEAAGDPAGRQPDQQKQRERVKLERGPASRAAFEIREQAEVHASPPPFDSS